MEPFSIVLAVVAGLLIGFSMGTVGGGGAIMAVPVLVYGLAQTPVQATTASLVIVGVTGLQGAFAAWRRQAARIDDGLLFGVTAVAGAVLGAGLSTRVPARWLMAAFVVVLLLTAVLQIRRLVRGRGVPPPPEQGPMVTWRPFRAEWGRVAGFFAVATSVGLLTGFLGVGGGFMIVPALAFVLGMSMHRAAGTSLVVMVVTAAAALLTRMLDNPGPPPDWWPVVIMTAMAIVGSVVGGRVAHRADGRQLAIGFTVLICLVAVYTLVRLVPEFV